MLAELDEVPGKVARWRFALGGAWAGLVASGPEPVAVAGMAVVLGVAGGVGAVAYTIEGEWSWQQLRRHRGWSKPPRSITWVRS